MLNNYCKLDIHIEGKLVRFCGGIVGMGLCGSFMQANFGSRGGWTRVIMFYGGSVRVWRDIRELTKNSSYLAKPKDCKRF